MSALKPLTLGILVWAASGSVIRADPITLPSNINWVAYFAGQNGDGGGFSAPASTSPAALIAPVASQLSLAQQALNPAVTQPPPAVQAAPISVVANAPVMQPPSALRRLPPAPASS